ncbi:MAG TPA: cytidine deaminase [Acholeplasmataceae bacterium]|jgi:cytidine deaminase|nr:cytidine deaminase [Acholeplasmataceae bacterium]
MKFDEAMYKEVLQAYNNAYAPYSKFHVGAVILLKNGKYITGSNVENASYGLSNCAERSALFNAYSQGYRKADIEKIMVIGNTDTPISPCGACRQVMSELMDKDATVILTNLNKDIKEYKVKDLLPYSFEGEVLDNGN